MPFFAHIIREVFWWMVDFCHEAFIGKLGRWAAWLVSFGRWDVDEESWEDLTIGWGVFVLAIRAAAAWRCQI